MGIEKIAPDGGRCFGYSINGNGQAVCEMIGDYCECRGCKCRSVCEDGKTIPRGKQLGIAADLDAYIDLLHTTRGWYGHDR
jgi:hypothetical protein